MEAAHVLLGAVSISITAWTLWSAEREARSNEADLYAQIGHFIRSRL